jgi:hypothetical protein
MGFLKINKIIIFHKIIRIHIMEIHSIIIIIIIKIITCKNKMRFSKTINKNQFLKIEDMTNKTPTIKIKIIKMKTLLIIFKQTTIIKKTKRNNPNVNK